MDKNLKTFIAQILIIISVFVIGLGFYYDNFGTKKLIKVTNTPGTSEEVEETNISVTTTDSLSNGEEAVSNDPGIANEDTSSTTNNNSVNNSSSSNGSSNVQTNNSTVQNNISTNTLTIDQVNDNLRKNIENTYGVSIKYGTETVGYSVGGMGTNQMTDSSSINTALSNLNYNMSLYPTGFFREFNNIGLNLTIYLIKNYSTNGVTGVTDSSSKNVIMSLATDYSFSESFNHETYHYIEDYIVLNGGGYSTWNNLNPSGFVYGNIDKSLTYTNTSSSSSYFVNSYAEVNEYEDRASTFEYMTASYKASCLNAGNTIYLKATYMANQIDLFFKTVTPTTREYWEKYL